MASIVRAAAVVVLALAVFLISKARRRYSALPVLPQVAPAQTPPDCMVVIPARNDESSIGIAVKSLPPDTVIVVDEHSSDATAERAREAGAGVLPAPSAPRDSNWRANACMAGARILTSRWILFAGAEAVFEPGFLNSAVDYAASLPLDFLTIRSKREQYLLVRREAYEYIGGYKIVVRHPEADSRLLEIAKRHRLHIGAVRLS